MKRRCCAPSWIQRLPVYWQSTTILAAHHSGYLTDLAPCEVILFPRNKVQVELLTQWRRSSEMRTTRECLKSDSSAEEGMPLHNVTTSVCFSTNLRCSTAITQKDEMNTGKQHLCLLTSLFSFSLVTMTMILLLSCHTMSQKSPTVCTMGPWVAM